MRYTHILWDFNGTILDDVAIGVEAVNALLQRHKKPLLSGVEAYRAHFGFPVAEYYAFLGLERENFSQYAVEWVNEYNAREPQAKVYDGVAELLCYFEKERIPQYLVSATEREMLKAQIDRLGLCRYFAEQVGGEDVEAHGKLEAAKAFASRIKPKRALFIGDSLHDFEVATAIGAECVLLAYGHQSKARLEAVGCRVFDNARALLAAFENGEIG